MKESRSSKSRKFKRLVSAIFIAATLLVFSSLAGAVIINVTIEGDITDPSDELLSLREAFFAADFIEGNDTIVLASNGSYQLTDCVAGELEVTDDADLIVEGNGSTITQTCSDQRILNKKHDFSNDFILALNQLSLKGGPNSGVNIEGAAIKASSKLVLTEVSITDVNAHGGSIISIDFGSVDFDLEMDHVTIIGNTGTAISNDNPSGVKVSNSTVSDNTGSGISLADGTPIMVVNSTISNNGGLGVSTTGQGENGAQPDVTIVDSVISGNQNGGVFCSFSCRQVTITNSQITNNGISSVATLGGGINVSIPPFTSQAKLTIEGSTITGNQADHAGGGISSFGDSSGAAPTLISNSTIANNIANGRGGAISVVGIGELVVVDSTISGNTANGDGGGISQKDNDGNNVDVIGQSKFSLSGTSVTDNQSGEGGGGLSINASQASINLSLIQGNTATLSGGGLLAGGIFSYSSGNTSIIGSTISDNTAGYGGGVSVGGPRGSLVEIENSTVDGNTATIAGGGFAVGDFLQLRIDHATVVENSAPTGANIAVSGSTTLSRTIIAQPIGGGTNCAPHPGSPGLGAPLITNHGFSWFSDATCEASAADIVDPGVNPQLGPLADNGGPTPTRLPTITSPVVGLVPVTDCPLPSDQRETPRPSGLACEAGAVEIAEGMVYQLPGNQWHQISLPSNPGNNKNKVAHIFGDDDLGTLGTDWALFRYDTNRGEYVELQNNDQLYQGIGYWIIQRTGSSKTIEMPLDSTPTPVTSLTGCLESASGCFEVTLEAKASDVQWHMIGYPFVTANSLDDSRVTALSSCLEGCMLDAALNKELFHNQVWSYNGKTYDIIKGSDNLEPWRAYWSATLSEAPVNSPVKLLIPKP